MSLALLIAIGGLTTAGIYLVTSRSLSRMILGFSLLGHATVLALVVSGGPPGVAPVGPSTDVTNPLPQALGLTAIVISFGLTLFLLALAVRQQTLTGDDLVEDDIEDRRIAHADDDSADADTPTSNDRMDDDPVDDGSSDVGQQAGSGTAGSTSVGWGEDEARV